MESKKNVVNEEKEEKTASCESSATSSSCVCA